MLQSPNQRLDVRRQANEPGSFDERPEDGFPDPPHGVVGEFAAALPLESLHRLHQAEVAFLDEIEKEDAAAAAADCLDHVDDETEVRLNQHLARSIDASLVAPGRTDDCRDLLTVRLARAAHQPVVAGFQPIQGPLASEFRTFFVVFQDPVAPRFGKLQNQLGESLPGLLELDGQPGLFFSVMSRPQSMRRFI